MPFPALPGLPPNTTVTGVVDYDIQKVEWNKYELNNGATVCFLQVPLVVFATNRTDPRGVAVYGILWNNFSRVVAPEGLTGNPSPQMTPDQIMRLAFEPVTPLTNQEPWNEFLLRDGHTIRGRAILTQLRHVIGHFDNSGMPIYSVYAQTVVDVQVTDKRRRTAVQ